MNERPPTRQFLGWGQPILHSVADALVKEAGGPGPVDLSRDLVVLPGSRAGRRLKELLLDRAIAMGRALRPPEISTVGGLPERLYHPRLPAPGSVLDRQVWRLAVRGLDRVSLARIARVSADGGARTDGLPGVLSAVAQDLHRDVSAAGLAFRDVADRCGGLPFNDDERWVVLADLQDEYCSILSKHGFCDREASRREALALGEISSPLRIWLAGAPDLSPIARAFVQQVRAPEPVRILVGAPPSLSHAFDHLGCVVPDAWATMRADLPDEAIHVAHGPGAQADAVVRTLSGLGGRVPAEEITIGVPDAEVVPYVAERLAEQGVRTRYAAGVPLSRTHVFRLLADLANYLESPDFSLLGSLLRHPPFERMILRKMGAPPEELVQLFDRYQSLHLLSRVDSRRLPSAGERPSDPLQPRVRAALDAISELLSPLAGEHTLEYWSPRIADLLEEIFTPDCAEGGRSRTGKIEQVEVLGFVESAGETLDLFLGLPAELDPPVSAQSAVRDVLDQLRGLQLSPEAEDEAVELLGWLELPLDDAEVMVVTGFNEPYVPESVTSHPFLPHRLHQALGLLDNAGRWARDLLYLRTIQETRSGAVVITGRWDGEGTPLLPSRLLFAEGQTTAVERVMRCFREGGGRGEPVEGAVVGAPSVLEPMQHDLLDGRDLVAGPGVSGDERFLLPPVLVLSAASVPDRIPVTSFRSLLTDPYRYALERVLCLRRVDDQAWELDPLGFGALAHTVLERFGRESASSSEDADTIQTVLFQLLRQEAERRFGKEPLAAVRMQIAQLRTRLAAFAEWQSNWVEEGWRIRQVEVSPSHGGAPFPVDGEPILLSGKLDRVDYNERTGQWCILDYKTGERVLSPEASHRRGPRGAKRWVDLQLPLYRRLARELEDENGEPLIPAGSSERILVGYVAISRDLRVRELLAEWTHAELSEADEVACEVVRLLRANRFGHDPLSSTIRPEEALAPVVGGRVLRMFDSPEGEWDE